MSEGEKNKQKASLLDIIDTIKWIATISISVMALGIVFLTLYAGLSLKAEKDSIQELKSELQKNYDTQVERINKALLKVEKKPQLIALTNFSEPLNGKTINAEIIKDGTKYLINFKIILKNIGKENTNFLMFKYYSKEPLALGEAGERSSDEIDYTYETISSSEFSNFNDQLIIIPLSATSRYNIKGPIFGAKPDPGFYPILIKVYYGEVDPLRTEFFIKIE